MGGLGQFRSTAVVCMRLTGEWAFFMEEGQVFWTPKSVATCMLVVGALLLESAQSYSLG